MLFRLPVANQQQFGRWLPFDSTLIPSHDTSRIWEDGDHEANRIAQAEGSGTVSQRGCFRLRRSELGRVASDDPQSLLFPQ